MDDYLCRYGIFMHFTAKSCIREMATLPDGGGVAKPEFFLVLDFQCNFPTKKFVNWAPASHFGGKKLCNCWESQFSFKPWRENEACV